MRHLWDKLGVVQAVLVVSIAVNIGLALWLQDKVNDPSACAAVTEAYEFTKGTGIPEYRDSYGDLNRPKLDGWVAGHDATRFEVGLVVIDYCGEAPLND